TASYSTGLPKHAPCAVVCLGCAGVAEKWGEYQGIGGRASVFGDIVLFSARGQVVNVQRVTTENQRLSSRTLVEQMVRDYRALSSLEVAPIIRSLERIAGEWPAERSSATQEMFGLFDLKWQAREIMEHTAPMRRTIEGVGHAHVDYSDLLTASQAL